MYYKYQVFKKLTKNMFYNQNHSSLCLYIEIYLKIKYFNLHLVHV